MPKKITFSARLDMPIAHIARLCRVTRPTVLRWERDGYPHTAEILCSLERDGRVMPDKWTHSKFNARGNLELYSGEIKENDVLNIPHTRTLLRKLRREIELLQKEKENLKTALNALDTGAANDVFY